MARVILLLILLLVLVYFIYRYKRLSPEQKKQALKLVLFTGLGAVLVYLVLTGRLHALAAAIGALVPLIPRFIRFVIGMGPSLLPFFRRYQQNRHSSMQTKFLRLQINIITGELQGEVLEGKFQGQKLQQMPREALLELMAECREQDAESAALLSAYLDRTHKGWSAGGGESQEYTPRDSDMSVQEARDILGVAEDATKEEIIHAHKRMMQKMHPDRGGSDYLAKQINLAKDKLLALF